jgi:hypothetical protein
MRRAVCFVLTVLAASAVGSAQAPSHSPADSPACSWLTKEDAAAALGEAVTGPNATSMGKAQPSSCEYEGSGIHRVQLTVMPFDAPTAAMYKAMCAKKNKDGLTGLGDVACWYNDKHAELQVMKGQTMFSINLSKSGDPTEAIKGVARKVYERVK